MISSFVGVRDTYLVQDAEHAIVLRRSLRARDGALHCAGRRAAAGRGRAGCVHGPRLRLRLPAARVWHRSGELPPRAPRRCCALGRLRTAACSAPSAPSLWTAENAPNRLSTTYQPARPFAAHHTAGCRNSYAAHFVGGRLRWTDATGDWLVRFGYPASRH